jgi:hypothetical protein
MSAEIQKIASQLEFLWPYDNSSQFYMHFSCILFNNNFFLKSQKGNGIWTFLKMSKNENPKKVLKMALFLHF